MMYSCAPPSSACSCVDSSRSHAIGAQSVRIRSRSSRNVPVQQHHVGLRLTGLRASWPFSPSCTAKPASSRMQRAARRTTRLCSQPGRCAASQATPARSAQGRAPRASSMRRRRCGARPKGRAWWADARSARGQGPAPPALVNEQGVEFTATLGRPTCAGAGLGLKRQSADADRCW
jgi:hypothetical protein